jgi:hypothetical protein
MKKKMMILLLVCAMASFAVYTVGSTVKSNDNISWTITGPDPYTGQSDNLFNMIGSKCKPVVLFFGNFG